MNENEVIDARKMLGVTCDCSLTELNKRYRIMALRLHPDKNGNTPEATEAFQELNAAYRMLLPGVTHDDDMAKNDAPHADADTETYANIFLNFMKSLFHSKSKNPKDDATDAGNQALLELLHRIVHDYASVSVHSALDALDPSVLFQLYETLKQYNSAVSMNARIFEEITHIIREKMRKNNIMILSPSLKDVIQNNISVVKIEGQTFYVPLWHSELHYRIEASNSDEANSQQLIVKCMPNLPDHMSIDANNELHIDVRADIKELLNRSAGVLRIPLYDDVCIDLNVRDLSIVSHQTVVLKNNIRGISLICANDIYDVANKAPICVHVHLV
jgi:hypothetical protein